MAGQRRHHYVPKMLLRRFAVGDGRWQGHIWRLDKATGRPRPAVPKTEAAKNKYYELRDDLLGGEFQPERIFEKIESGASLALRRLEREEAPADEEMWMLAYFTAL
jgi:Protein of unknown function (DUF4238)